MPRFLRAQMERLARTVEQASIDVLAPPPESGPARRARRAGNRLMGCTLLLAGLAGVADRYRWVPGTALDIANVLTFAVFCVSVRQHAWASGYTARDTGPTDVTLDEVVAGLRGGGQSRRGRT